jgi:hypothetical protein
MFFGFAYMGVSASPWMLAGLIDDEELGMIRFCPLLGRREVRPEAGLISHGKTDDGRMVFVALDGASQAIDNRVAIVLSIRNGL